ncbi:hypothetical protein, partial [Streptomyces sp. NPDC058157]|uniref:hypothetical protein n=1 Tax=Streptomyces sp. NPDC058157 TaxID=3346360 RepID=UPI0036E76C3F
MARRRTELEKEPGVDGERFTPFAEVFTASADADTEAEAQADADAGSGAALRAGGERERPRAEDPEEILAEPPDTRDISAELAAPPRARMPWLT